MIARRAVASDLDAAASLLGVAFADDPWTQWCVDADDHVGRITKLQRISLEVLGLPFGLVWLTELNAQPVSVAVWSDSSVVLDGSLFSELAHRSTPLHGNRLDAAVAAETAGFDRPTAPHLFVETMGTHPDHQRRGFGAAVLRPGLALADRSGLMCALETSTEGNVAFYQTVGFEVVHHRVVTDRTLDQRGPDVWTMWRPSQP